MGLLASATISGVTAVLTVTLTIWLYQKRDKLNALRVIKSEAVQNRETAETIYQHINGDMVLRQDDKEQPSSLNPFATHAFQNAKNTGVLARLPKDIREPISEHYTDLGFINHQLQHRQQMRGTSRALSGYSEMMISIDRIILLNLLKVAEFDGISVDGNMEEVDITGDETPSFDDIEDTVDKELDEHPILDRLL